MKLMKLLYSWTTRRQHSPHASMYQRFGLGARILWHKFASIPSASRTALSSRRKFRNLQRISPTTSHVASSFANNHHFTKTSSMLPPLLMLMHRARTFFGSIISLQSMEYGGNTFGCSGTSLTFVIICCTSSFFEGLKLFTLPASDPADNKHNYPPYAPSIMMLFASSNLIYFEASPVILNVLFCA